MVGRGKERERRGRLGGRGSERKMEEESCRERGRVREGGREVGRGRKREMEGEKGGKEGNFYTATGTRNFLCVCLNYLTPVLLNNQFPEVANLDLYTALRNKHS